MHGVVERIQGAVISGWVKVARANLAQGSAPKCAAYIKGHLIGESDATVVREDVSDERWCGLSFAIRVAAGAVPDLDEPTLTVVCQVAGESFPVTLWKPVELALATNRLDGGAAKVMANHLGEGARLRLGLCAADRGRRIKEDARRQIGLVTYANDAGAWFPYFYKYYADLLGCDSIYVITPMPHAFSDFDLGGVISIAGCPYDDAARSRLVSGFASGLQAYFDWTLVCDVDEIIIPHPASGKSFHEVLSSAGVDVLGSRGLDVVQLPEEKEFDFTKSVREQRSLAVPNSAMSKPHFSRAPLKYSGGYHYCDKPLSAPNCDGFLTLHLKWACSRIREEVQGIASNTLYSDGDIRDYSLRSVARTFHPLVDSGRLVVESLTSGRWLDFDQAAFARARFSPELGTYYADFQTANFFVDIRHDALDQVPVADVSIARSMSLPR